MERPWRTAIWSGTSDDGWLDAVKYAADEERGEGVVNPRVDLGMRERVCTFFYRCYICFVFRRIKGASPAALLVLLGRCDEEVGAIHSPPPFAAFYQG